MRIGKQNRVIKDLINATMKFDLLNINSVWPLVRQILKYKKSGSVLDLGSGIGHSSLFLAKRGFRVTAVDNSTVGLTALKELARLQKLPIKVELEDVTRYHPKKKYDVIISTMVHHFIPYKSQKEAIAGMQAATKKTGVNVVAGYSNKNTKKVRPYLVKGQVLKKQYTDAGWEILHFQERLSDPMTTSAGGKKTVRYWIVDLIAQKS